MRPRRSPGCNSTSSPTRRAPPFSVPVTTVPKPLMVKTRSTGKRGWPKSWRVGRPPGRAASCVSKASMPAPVVADTGRTGASARQVSASSSRASSSTSSSHSGSSTRSTRERTTTPASMPNRSRIARCSRVCGITPSSAAIASRTASIPPTPASMFSMKSR